MNYDIINLRLEVCWDPLVDPGPMVENYYQFPFIFNHKSLQEGIMLEEETWENSSININ